jgi:bacillithiol system protein YtxJ
VPWSELTHLSQLDEWLDRSFHQPILFFKHSTRCSISAAAYGRMERDMNTLPDNYQLVYLDLLAHRDISNAIAARLGVEHESPQILLVQAGKCVWHGSHMEVRPSAVPVLA